MSDSVRVFDTEAERYDAWFDTPEGRVLFQNELHAIRLLWRGACRPALEVGAGTGRFAEALNVEYGLDPAAGALRLAKQRGIQVGQSRGETLPFTDGSFSGVQILATLCFADDPAAMLVEAGRVLRPDGRLLVADIPKDSPWGEHYLQKKAGGHPFYRYARFFTVGELVDLLHGAGWRPVAFSSTLVQSQPGTPRREEARTGLVHGAGFVCVLAQKRGGPQELLP